MCSDLRRRTHGHFDRLPPLGRLAFQTESRVDLTVSQVDQFVFLEVNPGSLIRQFQRSQKWKLPIVSPIPGDERLADLRCKARADHGANMVLDVMAVV